MIKHLVIFISLLPAMTGFSQEENIRHEILNIVDQIALNNTFEVAALPETKSDQIALYDSLKSLATEKELIQLAGHKNGVVRVYAMKTLLTRDSDEYMILVEQLLRDRELVECINIGFEFVHTTISKMSVADLVLGFYPLSKSNESLRDSLLLYRANDCKMKQCILAEKIFTDGDYQQVRKLAKKNKNPAAAIALARFQNARDVKLISLQIRRKAKKGYDYTIHEAVDAIQHFPHSKFKDDLIYLQRKGKHKEFYAAIQYGDTFASQYFEHFIDTYNGRYSRYTFNNELKKLNQIMQENPSELYNDLHFKIWEKNGIINDSLLQQLIITDPQRCEDIGFPFIEAIPTLGFDRTVLDNLLSFLVIRDEMKTTQIVCYELEHSEVFQFKCWAEIAERIDPIFTQGLLLDRYKKESNAHIGIPIIKALLSYNQPRIDQLALEAINSNKEMSDWAMEKILKMLHNRGLEL